MTTTRFGPEQVARRKRTVLWVVAIAFFGLLFDGYDLLVYGTVLPIFLRDPSQIGPVTPALGGALGSYLLIGVLIGSLLAGAFGDYIGRRKVMLTAYAWFAVGMALVALTSTTFMFGLMRFLSGLAMGALIATTGALVTEFAPPGRKNYFTAVAYAAVPAGSLIAALLAILLLGTISWRGMFLIGAVPLVTVLPLALFKLPESPAWLASRGRQVEAQAAAERTGVSLTEVAADPDSAQETTSPERVGFAGLFGRDNAWPAILFGLVGVVALLNIFALQTWLPELMRRAGYSTQGSLSFLLVINGGAILGSLLLSRVADRLGPKMVVAVCFLVGAISIGLMTVVTPVILLLLLVAIVGLGTSGTQNLYLGFLANYFRTNVRGAAMAWGAGFGRLGGIGGPLVVGVLVGGGLALNSIFFVLAGLALIGTILTLLIPARRPQPHAIPIEPSAAAPGGTATATPLPTTVPGTTAERSPPLDHTREDA